MSAANMWVRAQLPILRILALAGCLAAAGFAQAASIRLTDSAVFSANGAGENWNGWIWNTQAPPADTTNRWNLYYSSSSDPQNPVFLNSENGATTNIDIAMTPGTHRFLIYGESATPSFDPALHFVLSLYFDGNQASPDVSGLYGQSCPSVCAVSHWNGLDLFGVSGLGSNADAQEAGTLLYVADGQTVELTRFTWLIDDQVDSVWDLWDDTAPYSNGSGRPDFVGEIWLTVSAAVPIPGSLSLWLAGFGALVVAAGGLRRPATTTS